MHDENLDALPAQGNTVGAAWVYVTSAFLRRLPNHNCTRSHLHEIIPMAWTVHEAQRVG